MKEVRGSLNGAGLRAGVVVSRFNEGITEELLSGALEGLRENGVAEERIVVARVPGAWELALAARRLIEAERVALVVALGCVIRGETAHFDFIAGEAARRLGEVALDTGVPVAFGVLTTETEEQAWARAGGRGSNKGREAALSALEMANLLRSTGG